MKLVFVSDIHGNFSQMKKVIENEISFDKLFLSGDILSGPNISGYDPERLIELLNLFHKKIVCVRGNCDRFIPSSLAFPLEKDYLLFPVSTKKIFMTHGHIYNRYHMPDVFYDVYVQGHMHRAMMEESGGKLYLNPGSITSSRGGPRSYLVYENGVFSLKEVDTNIVVRSISFSLE